MESILIDDRLDPGQFSDMVDQGRGIIAEESVTTSATGRRLAGEGLADILGRDQDTVSLAMLGLTTAFFAGGKLGWLSLGPDEVGGRGLVRVGGVELEPGLEVSDPVLEVANPLMHHKKTRPRWPSERQAAFGTRVPQRWAAESS